MPGVDEEIAGGAVNEIDRRLPAVGRVGQLQHNAFQFDDAAQHGDDFAICLHRYTVANHIALAIPVQLPVGDVRTLSGLLLIRQGRGYIHARAAAGDHFISRQQQIQPGEKSACTLISIQQCMQSGGVGLPCVAHHPGDQLQLCPVGFHIEFQTARKFGGLLRQALKTCILLHLIDLLGDPQADRRDQQNQNQSYSQRIAPMYQICPHFTSPVCHIFLYLTK